MLITREMLVKELSKESSFYQNDIRIVLKCLDDIISTHLAEATVDEDVWVQLFKGVKVRGFVRPERERINPIDRSPIVCPETCGVQVKISEYYKAMIDEKYQNNKDD